MNRLRSLYGTFSAMLICSFNCSVAICTEPTEITVAQEGFAATYYDAADEDKHVGVIVLGGAEGGRNGRQAQAFAAAGYPAMALAYFNAPGLPGSLDEIPLEYFMIGGTKKGNQEARLDSWERILTFLSNHFKDPGEK